MTTQPGKIVAIFAGSAVVFVAAVYAMALGGWWYLVNGRG